MKKTMFLAAAIVLASASGVWAKWEACTGEYAGYCRWGVGDCDPINKGENDDIACATAYNNCADNNTVWADDACSVYKAGNPADFDSPGCCKWTTGCWKIKNEKEQTDCPNIIPTCLDFTVGDKAGTCPTGGEVDPGQGPGDDPGPPPTPSGTGYKIFAYDINNTSTQNVGANSESSWGTDVFVYTYNGATIANPTNPHYSSASLTVDEGVLKLKSVSLPASGYPGAFLGIKTDDAKKITECTGGISYWYKGDAHWFLAEFDKALCTGTGDADDNKWGKTITPASTIWKQETVVLTSLKNANTWNTAACAAGDATKPPVDLSKIIQLTWGFDDGQKGTNLMIADVVCITSGGEQYSTSAPDAGITTSTGYFSGNGFPGDGPIQPIRIAHAVQGNTLTAMQNAVNLQSTGNAKIQIFDLKGKAVRTQTFSQGSYVVPLSGLPKGLYIVKASNASWKQTIKVTVK